MPFPLNFTPDPLHPRHLFSGLLRNKHQKGEKEKLNLSQSEFIRNTFLDVLGLALVVVLAMWLGRMSGSYAGARWGLLAGIVAGMAVGFGVGFFVQKGWSRVAEPLKV